MTFRASVLAVAALLVTASPSVGQSTDPLPRFAVDLRGASVGLPTGEGWTPPVPAGTQIPGRTLGLAGGAHVYILRFKLGAIGLGGTMLIGRGKTKPPDPTSTSTTTTLVIPEVTTTLTSLVPQLSFNFGHGSGWSYISGGIGRTRAKGHVTRPATATSPVSTESAWARTVNYGGGARWFINDHLAFSLDLRWYKVARIEATATSPALPKQSLLVAGAGISFK